MEKVIDKLAELMNADPRAAQLMLALAEGQSPVASYVRLFGPAVRECAERPELLEEISKAESDYAERQAKGAELNRQFEANLAETLETLKQFQAEREMLDEEIDSLMDALMEIVRDGFMGKFSAATLELMVKARNHDADVEAAKEAGAIEGRNAKITEELRRSSKGDGVAHLGGRNVGAADRRSRSLFDLASQAV